MGAPVDAVGAGAGRNPIFSDRIFAPAGIDLARTTFIPGPAFVM